MKIQLQLKPLIKYSNFLIFAIVLTLFFIIEPYQKFSLELVSILSDEDRKSHQLSKKFNYGKTFLVSVKGFEKNNLKKLNKIKKELSSHPEIFIKNQLNNKKLKEFKQKYSLYLNNLNYSNSSDINVKNDLSNIYNTILSSSFYFNINQKDPFNIIKHDSMSNKLKLKNGNLILEEYGYLAIFSINTQNDENSRIKLYNEIHETLMKYENTKSFSSMFYYVENSEKIQYDVKKIIIVSMIFLGILYLIMLRNLYLFINVAATLVSSVIIGQIVITYLFTQVSIITLAFGTAITSVSIDYMFHHYLHNYYNKRAKFNKTVFYGFVTTILAFILISFIDFALIKQISIFTVISLSIAYIHFSFIYPYLQIKYVEPYSMKKYKSPFAYTSSKIVLFSIIMIGLSIFYVKFDFNIKNLDYQNQKLIHIEQFFKSRLGQNKMSAIFIMANDIDSIISNSKIIKSIDKSATAPMSSLLSQNEYIKRQEKIENFNFFDLKNRIKETVQEVGFKKDYFKDSYNESLLYPDYPAYTKQMIQEFGFDLIYNEKQYITLATVSSQHLDEVLALDFIEPAQSKILFENSLKKVYSELIIFGAITICLIIGILVVVTKERFWQAISYILFPASLILLYGMFVPLNIMHIFMTFVILAIGIDYGIYMNESNLSKNTTLAIIYSLISTFAGFGVLIISDINSLSSIAITSIIGIFGILFLLLFQKRLNASNNKI